MLVIAACQELDTDGDAQVSAVPPATQQQPGSTPDTSGGLVPPLQGERYHMLEPDRSATFAPSNAGPVPAKFMAWIEEDLQRLVGPDQVLLVRDAKTVVWPNDALACQQDLTGPVNAAPVPGYQVIFEVEGTHYDYRLADDGSFLRCDRATSRRDMVPAS
ncbi:MAG: hypothetical protein AAF529_08700 [Pseudomonadota bacterium]